MNRTGSERPAQRQQRVTGCSGTTEPPGAGALGMHDAPLAGGAYRALFEALVSEHEPLGETVLSGAPEQLKSAKN